MATVTLPLPLSFSNNEQPFTVEIPLTKGYVTIIDTDDSDLAHHKWYVALYRGHSQAMRWQTIDANKKVAILLHRSIMERILQRPLTKGEIVDHKDGDALNNRRSNLRLATHAQNMQNRRMHRQTQSGVKGVGVRPSGRFRAVIYHNKVRHHLGTFDTLEEAKEAYRLAALHYFGEFANVD